MNELLQKHGCSNVFTIPEGLRELMSDISREVLREQPTDIYSFIAKYLSVLLITREHGILTVKILDDLCDCRPSVSEHLLQIGLQVQDAQDLARIIKDEVEKVDPTENETVKELEIVEKILQETTLDEDMAAKVCQITRNAYRDYWYRKKTLEEALSGEPPEAWEIAAQNTLDIYKKTKPSFAELQRAAEKIQAAYRGYYTRKSLIGTTVKVMTGEENEPDILKISDLEERDYGPVIDINNKVGQDDVCTMLGEEPAPGIQETEREIIDNNVKDARRFTTTTNDEEVFIEDHRQDRAQSRMMAVKKIALPGGPNAVDNDDGENKDPLIGPKIILPLDIKHQQSPKILYYSTTTQGLKFEIPNDEDEPLRFQLESDQTEVPYSETSPRPDSDGSETEIDSPTANYDDYNYYSPPSIWRPKKYPEVIETKYLDLDFRPGLEGEDPNNSLRNWTKIKERLSTIEEDERSEAMLTEGGSIKVEDCSDMKSSSAETVVDITAFSSDSGTIDDY